MTQKMYEVLVYHKLKGSFIIKADNDEHAREKAIDKLFEENRVHNTKKGKLVRWNKKKSDSIWLDVIIKYKK